MLCGVTLHSYTLTVCSYIMDGEHVDVEVREEERKELEQEHEERDAIKREKKRKLRKRYLQNEVILLCHWKYLATCRSLHCRKRERKM